MNMARNDPQFEVLLDAEMNQLDRELGEALAPEPPEAQRTERVWMACELSRALHSSPRAGLGDDIFDATVSRLSRGAVLARIVPRILRVAAVVTLLASIPTIAWLVSHRAEQHRQGWGDLARADVVLREFARDAQAAGHATGDLRAQSLTLAVEIDQLALAVEDDTVREVLGDVPEGLGEDLMLMEVQPDALF